MQKQTSLNEVIKRIKKIKLLVTLKHNDFNVLRKSFFGINFNFSIYLT